MSKTYIIHQDIDNWYVNKNLFYILGFDPSLGTVIFDDEEIALIFDSRYFWRIEKLNKSYFDSFFWKKMKIKKILLDHEDAADKVDDFVKWKDLVIESNVPTYFYKYIKKTDINDLEFEDNIFEERRIIKTEKEKNNIMKANQIVQKIYAEIEKMAKKWEIKWKKEIELRKIIQKMIIDFWWSDESFSSIIAFWKNSAIPHHEAWNTIIWDWPLLIDMWVKYNWYLSDFSRSLWIWEKNKDFDEYQKILEIAKSAFEEWKKFLEDKSSVSAFLNDENSIIKWSDVDKVVRDYIESQWYWKNFTHSSWHWIWLQEHEKPFISKNKWNDILKRWMVFTIEPWIYIPWKFWVRWENIIFL